jgi:glycosyltransferase involved in cell wall biosynthesis
MGAEVIYLSFDGMTDPLGRSQVLPYLAGLGARGHRIRLVSLEKPAAFDRDWTTADAICRAAGIEWWPLPYRSRPPIASGIANLRALRREAERLHLERPADFVHCRSDLPAIAGLALKRRHGLPLLYDMRAFWPDERAEGGAWDQRKRLYRAIFRFFKKRQRALIAQADELVTLTQEGRRALLALGIRPAERPVTVVQCCADFDLFVPPSPETRREARARLGLADDARLLIHLGSIGANCLLEEMLDFFAVYRERYPEARFLLVAPSGEDAIHEAAEQRGVDDAVEVRAASREEVPGWLAAADLGIMFVRPIWSKKAASPTKLGEMLAMGLPVLANTGVGDVAEMLRQSRAGIAVDRFDPGAYRAAIDALDRLPLSSEDIRREGWRWFDLEQGIASYDAIYRRLAEGATEVKERARG